MKKLEAIFVSVGHGESMSGRWDPGAMSLDGKISEREIIVSVAKELSFLLPKEKTFFIGNEGSEENLVEKISEINAICKKHSFSKEGTLGVSIHANYAAPTASGTFALYQSNDDREKDFSIVLGAEVAKSSGLRDLTERPDTWTGHGRLGILRDTIPTFALIELGFMNKDLETLVKHPKKFAEGIKNAIEKFSGERFDRISEKNVISRWAKKSVLKAINSNAMMEWKNPQEIVDEKTIQWVFHNLGFIKKMNKKGMTREQLAVALDRAGLLG